MNQTIKWIALSGIILLGYQGFSQTESNPIDSLKQSLAKNPQKDTVRIQLLLDLYSESTNQQLDREISKKYIDEALSTARAYGNVPWLIKVLLNQCNHFVDGRQYTNSTTALKEALDLSQANGLPKEEIKVLSALGALYATLEAYPKAVDYMKRAYQKAEAIGDKKTQKKALVNMGTMFGVTGNYHEALKTYQKVFSLHEDSPDWNVNYMLYQNIGRTYAALHQPQKAKLYFDSCQLVITQHNLPKFRQDNLDIFLAELYIKGFGQTDKAIVLLKSIISEPNGLPIYSLSEAHNLLAEAYLNLHNPRQAIVHAEKCLSLIASKEYINSRLNIEVFRFLSKAHGMLNEWEKANQYSEEAHVLRDTVQTQEEKRLAAYALIQHQIESNEAELAEKNTQLRIKSLIYQTVSLLGLPLLLMLAAAIYYRMKSKKERELREQQAFYANGLEIKVKERTSDLEVAHLKVQEAKERENVSLALLNQKHIELLDSLSKKLQVLQEENNANPNAIQPALNDIKSAQAQAEEWGSFMLHFERIHPSFAQQLQLKCPTISNNDIKHCAYMKLGMTRKQVADILSCTEDAVKLSRTRVRKKLGLTADDSLQEFINSI